MSQHAQLDAAIERRRVELDLSLKALADQSGMSEATLRNLRRGRHAPSARSKHRLEQTLLWQTGSVDAILGGGDPTPMPIPSADPTIEELERTRRVLIDAMRLDDPQLIRNALADALALVASALEHERRNAG